MHLKISIFWVWSSGCWKLVYALLQEALVKHYILLDLIYMYVF